MGSVIPSVYRASTDTSLPKDNPDITTSHAGLIYMMYGCIQQVSEQYSVYRLLERPIAIIGAGYSGLSLSRYLSDLGYQVNIFDIRTVDHRDSDNVNLIVNKFSDIGKSGLVILLSTDGESGFHSIQKFLTPNMVLLSNTFPNLRQEHALTVKQRGVMCFETYTRIPGIKVYPSFFSMDPHHFGGCFIQSYLESINNKYYMDDVETFTKDANSVGMTPYLKSL